MMENYQIRAIDEHTWQLCDPFRTYLYLAEGEKAAVLLDAGNGFSGLPRIVSSLTDQPVFTALTHGHFDHTGCAALFGRCLIHEADRGVLSEGFVPETRKLQISRFAALFKVELSDAERDYLVNAEEPRDVEYFREGDVLDLGGRSLTVIETPGHTRGSVCFLDEKNGYLFAGDMGCNREILVYFDHSGTVADVKASDEKLLSLAGRFTQVWPGHHECPLDASVFEDYREAAAQILENPAIGTKTELEEGYKILYTYKSIGISYTEEHVRQGSE